ncbi:MAG: hypothetical protein JSU63_18160 [Phycisphaerales bacterium]|nr:MAG: hypothetical protein JSU63_18160 [Phycisphaerales bacterium]
MSVDTPTLRACFCGCLMLVLAHCWLRARGDRPDGWEDCGPCIGRARTARTGVYRLKGYATGSIEIDKGDWTCVAAVDPLHTLRSEGEIKCKGNTCKAVFKGDPQLGLNGLVSGNLDLFKGNQGSANRIDFIDFCFFIVSIKRSGVESANTDCNKATTSHGDINGDGAVDFIDYRTMESKFLASSNAVCCAQWGCSFRIAISVKELHKWGLSDLAVADLNGDGMVDADDMILYQENPKVQEEALRRKAPKVSTTD